MNFGCIKNAREKEQRMQVEMGLDSQIIARCSCKLGAYLIIDFLTTIFLLQPDRTPLVACMYVCSQHFFVIKIGVLR